MNRGYLLDTDVLVAFLRGYGHTVSLLTDLAEREAKCSISTVTIVEVEAGIRSREKEKTNEFLDILEIYSLDRETAHLAGRFLREYRSRGISLGLADVIIGATAIIQHLTLLTYNARHYPMPEIKIFQPQ